MDASERSSSDSQSAGHGAASVPPRIPDHTVHRRIGSGSYGEVWLTQNVLGEWRAVKIVRRDKFDEVRPYDREFEGISHYAPISLLHPSLLRVLHVGRNEAEGHFYYVMELADDEVGAGEGNAKPSDEDPAHGLTLVPTSYRPRTLRHEIQRRGRLPFAECLTIALELATALEHLHTRGLVHRDVKPSNIVFIRGEAKLADIGLVANFENTLSQVGAEGYMPSVGFGTPQADLFALGKVLYEMSTGQDRMQCPKLPDLRALRPRDRKGILELNRVILKACHPSPARGYRSAAELKNDLRLLQEGSSLRLRRRLKFALVGLAALVVLLLAALAVQRTWSASKERASKRAEFIREAQFHRVGLRNSGWSVEAWRLLSNAASVRVDGELNNQAAATLDGADARVVDVLSNKNDSAVFFAADGRLVAVGGTNKSGPMASISGFSVALASRGSAPVCFDTNGEPLHFVPGDTNGFVLREINSGRVRLPFFLVGDPSIGENHRPVLAMTSDGSRVAAAVRRGSDGGLVAIWDARTGGKLREIPTLASALAFTPDGALLAVGDSNGRVTVHAASNAAELMRLSLRHQRTAIRSLAFTRDWLTLDATAGATNGWLLAVGNAGGDIVIWDTVAQQTRGQCTGSPYEVTALAFDPGGSTIASAGRYEARLWDVASGRAILRLQQRELDFAQGLLFSPTGNQLAVLPSGDRPELATTVWDIEWDRGVRVLRGLNGQVGRVWFSPDGRWLAANSHGWGLAIWEVEKRRLVCVLPVRKGGSPDNAGAAFHRDGRRFAFAAGRDAMLYDFQEGRVLDTWTIPFGYADHLQFDRRDRLLLLRREETETDAKPRRWVLRHLVHLGEAQILRQQTETNWVARNMELLLGGEMFVVTGHDLPVAATGQRWSVRGFDAATFQQKWSFEDSTNQSYWYSDPSGHWLIGYWFGTNNPGVFRAVDGYRQELLSEPVAALDAQGEWFVAGISNKGCVLYRRAEPADRITLGLDWQPSLMAVFSPDGKWLAWGTSEGAVLVADVAEVRQRMAKLGSEH